MSIRVFVTIISQIWHLSFLHFLLAIDVTVCRSLDFPRMLFRFEVFLYAQIGLMSNGYMVVVNMVYFLILCSLIDTYIGVVVGVDYRSMGRYVL